MAKPRVRALEPFQVLAVRSGDWWALTCDQLPGFFSQCRRYREVERAAREGIALLLERDPDTIVVVPRTDLGDVLEKKIRERTVAVHELERSQQEVGLASAEVVRDMAELGLTQRDAADVLGLSFQRVGQLWPR
jgi:hypothetical protein